MPIAYIIIYTQRVRSRGGG